MSGAKGLSNASGHHLAPRGLRRVLACAASLGIGLLLASGLFVLAGVAQAAPASAPSVIRPYPGAAPCNTTLQACISGANSGDVIQIAAGTFTESFTLSRAVSLVGAGPGLTWLKALPNDRVFTVPTGLTATVFISGVTIAGGSLPTNTGGVNFPGGGGVAVGVGLPGVTFDRVVFRQNYAAGWGGGLYAVSAITIYNSLFLSNTAGAGGGGLNATLGPGAVISNTEFTGNSAGVSGGGGAFLGVASVFLSRFEGNHSPAGRGGGLALIQGAVTGTDFISNTAQYGGGLFSYESAALDAIRLQGNTAAHLGGGAYVGESAAFTGAVVVDNLASDGGAVFFSNASRQAWITGSVFSGNVATTTAGTSGVVFGYVRAATQTQDGLVNTVMTGTGAGNSRAVQAGIGPAPALTGTTFFSHAVDVVTLGAWAPLSSGWLSETWPVDCPSVVTFTRPITIWYGAVRANGVPVLEMTSATNLISEGARSQFAASGRPAALLRGLLPWIDSGTTNIESVLLPYVTFDAEAHLRAALASAWRPAPYTAVVFDPPIDRGTETALMETISAPIQCDGGPQNAEYRFILRSAFFELNASAARQMFLPLVRR